MTQSFVLLFGFVASHTSAVVYISTFLFTAENMRALSNRRVSLRKLSVHCGSAVNVNYIFPSTLLLLINCPYPLSIKQALFSIAILPLSKTVFTFPVNSQPS